MCDHSVPHVDDTNLTNACTISVSGLDVYRIESKRHVVTVPKTGSLKAISDGAKLGAVVPPPIYWADKTHHTQHAGHKASRTIGPLFVPPEPDQTALLPHYCVQDGGDDGEFDLHVTSLVLGRYGHPRFLSTSSWQFTLSHKRPRRTWPPLIGEVCADIKIMPPPSVISCEITICCSGPETANF